MNGCKSSARTSCRILVGLGCNYSCPYCCNRLPGMLDRFRPTSLVDIPWHQYRDVCISGGEPTLPKNLETTWDIIQWVHGTRDDARVYLYTNLYQLPSWNLVENVDGWNIGFHPTQTSAAEFAGRVRALIDYISWFVEHRNVSVRVQAEDTQAHLLAGLLQPDFIKTWHRDDCNISADREDWFIVRP